MPNTYTKEQINEARASGKYIVDVYDSAHGTIFACENDGKKHDIGLTFRILLSALSTAEQERDDGEKMSQALKRAVIGLTQERDALKARVAELEAIPDRLRKLDISLCPEPHGEWSLLDGEKEIAFFGDSIESVIKQAEAAIVGKKEW